MNKRHYLFTILFLLLSNLLAEPKDLTVVNKKIVVNGQEANILALTQSNGTFGIRFKKGQNFDVILKNTLNIPTSIHWHGLILPNQQDGVAFVTQFPLYPNDSYHYRFPLVQSGTYWMHSHFCLQEQQLLSAPLIIESPEDDQIVDQEAILFLSDFSFTQPSEIFRNLRCKSHSKKEMSDNNHPDLVDVNYDAFLINLKTINQPDFLKVASGEKIRLRIINAASSTNFFIDLGALVGELIAVDGNRIQSFFSSQFEISVAQRLDIVVTIPNSGDIFPIIAIGEGTEMQAGYILATNKITEFSNVFKKLTQKSGSLNNRQEMHFKALFPLLKKTVDNDVKLELGGNMSKYIWTINGQTWPEVTPIIVEEGQRVQITFKNTTSMSHPMHLHGHVFQVKAINDQLIDGAMRDTVLVSPNSSVTIQFDANNPGVWPLHCHLLYHLEAGMLTVVKYKNFQQPL
ncbi:MAG: multicopper oxidase family protein [Parachlamydiaceae bacterium]|nr:multicopper oxidase family protein [Parachlamydiaceae bacterium]